MLRKLTKNDLFAWAGKERAQFLIDVCLIKTAEYSLGNIMLQRAQSEFCITSFWL